MSFNVLCEIDIGDAARFCGVNSDKFNAVCVDWINMNGVINLESLFYVYVVFS